MPKALIYILAGGAVIIGGIVVYNLTTKPTVTTTGAKQTDQTASDWAKGISAIGGIFGDLWGAFGGDTTSEKNTSVNEDGYNIEVF
jgi:hypothetical protein